MKSSKILKEGFLNKHKQGLFKKPQRRYFILSELRIEYYTDVKGQLKGTIAITSDMKVEKVTFKKQIGIKIETGAQNKKTYVLVPDKDDEREVDSWIQAIKMVLEPQIRSEGGLRLDNSSTHDKLVAPIPRGSGTSSGFPTKLTEYENLKIAVLEHSRHECAPDSYLIRYNNYLYCLRVFYQPQSVEFIQSKHVVCIHGYFEDDTLVPNTNRSVHAYCYITEFMYGGSLYSYVYYVLRYKEDKCKYIRTIIRDVVNALIYIYKSGFVFERLTPENTFIGHEGRIKLYNEVSRSSSARCTYDNIPEYFAPEILASKPFTKETILWFLGIFIHDVFTNTTPFTTDDGVDALYQKIREEEPKIDPSIPDSAGRLIRKLLQKEPQNRIGANGKFSDILEESFFIEEPNDYPLEDIASIKDIYSMFPRIDVANITEDDKARLTCYYRLQNEKKSNK